MRREPACGAPEPRSTPNPYCTAVPRKGKEPIVLDFATSQVAAGKGRVANNKKVQMEEGLLIDAAGHPTTDPGALYNPPYGAPLPFRPPTPPRLPSTSPPPH